MNNERISCTLAINLNNHRACTSRGYWAKTESTQSHVTWRHIYKRPANTFDVCRSGMRISYVIRHICLRSASMSCTFSGSPRLWLWTSLSYVKSCLFNWFVVCRRDVCHLSFGSFRVGLRIFMGCMCTNMDMFYETRQSKCYFSINHLRNLN